MRNIFFDLLERLLDAVEPFWEFYWTITAIIIAPTIEIWQKRVICKACGRKTLVYMRREYSEEWEVEGHICGPEIGIIHYVE